jgi:hypothetical protein
MAIEKEARKDSRETDLRETDHRAVITETRMTADKDRVDLIEIIRKEQEISMAIEKEARKDSRETDHRETDHKATNPALIKQKAECSLALISRVAKVIAVMTMLQQAAIAILKIVTAVADLMVDREIDSATTSQVKDLAVTLRHSKILKSIEKKKRDVSARKKTSVTKKITSMKRKKH